MRIVRIAVRERKENLGFFIYIYLMSLLLLFMKFSPQRAPSAIHLAITVNCLLMR